MTHFSFAQPVCTKAHWSINHEQPWIAPFSMTTTNPKGLVNTCHMKKGKTVNGLADCHQQRNVRLPAYEYNGLVDILSTQSDTTWAPQTEGVVKVYITLCCLLVQKHFGTQRCAKPTDQCLEISLLGRRKSPMQAANRQQRWKGRSCHLESQRVNRKVLALSVNALDRNNEESGMYQSLILTA